MSAESASVASTGCPMDAPACALALTLRVAVTPSENTGGLLAPGAFVAPIPGFDQSLVPSAFVACTSTS